MHKPESVRENETHKILWDFKIQTNNQILAKKILSFCEFCRSSVPKKWKIKESEIVYKHIDFAEKSVEYESDGGIIYLWSSWNGLEGLKKSLGN